MRKIVKRRQLLNKKLVLNIFLVLFLFLSIGYSTLSTNLNINGNLNVKKYYDNKLYNILAKEAETGGLAKEYTGEHQDSMDPSKSTEKIFHWYASNDTEGTQVLEKNNVVFANHCWQMIRTTDTGGVKMIYNGEVEDGKCLNTRGNHVGYLSTEQTSLNSSYWYGTDYSYDKSANNFTISGNTVQETWSDSTYQGLIGKYTCRLSSITGNCSRVYYIDEYYSNTEANTISIYPNSKYSQFGTLEFNKNASSLANVGYMYGDVYNPAYPLLSDTVSVSIENNFLSYSYKDDFYYVGDTISYDTQNNSYSLINPRRISSVSSDSLVGKYLINSSNTSSSTVYYLVGVSGSSLYGLKLENGKDVSDYEPFLLGDSITDNGNDTYTINNVQSVSLIDWYTNYQLYNNYYICADNSTTCNNPHYIIYTQSIRYYYVEAGKKLLLAKERNGLVLSDTVIVRMDELYKNTSYYSPYKYTCNNLNSTCSEDTLSIINNYRTSTNSFTYSLVFNHYFGNSVTWDGTKYSLVNTVGIENYGSQLSNNHYVCEEPGATTCEKVYYIFREYASIALENGVLSIEEAINGMLTKNITDSTIKKGIDLWYKKYMYQEYDNYIDDVIYCNNRKISDKRGWNPNGGSISNLYDLKFQGYNSSGSLKCSNITDSFSTENNLAKLSYKIGLAANSEMNLIGKYISKTGQNYWLLWASQYSTVAHMSSIIVDGSISRQTVYNSTQGVRPTIALKPNIKYSRGTGSMADPYIVDTNNS